MFPLNSRVSVRAYGGITAQITDSVAHLLSESTIFKTKVACGHVQWYDKSMKWETHFKGEIHSSADAFMCDVWCRRMWREQRRTVKMWSFIWGIWGRGAAVATVVETLVASVSSSTLLTFYLAEPKLPTHTHTQGEFPAPDGGFNCRHLALSG